MIKVNKLIKGIRLVSTDIGLLVRRELDFIKMRPRTATVFLTFRCNSRCKTCSFWKRDHQAEKQREIGLDEWKTVMDRLIYAGINNMELFGGNVLLRKDLLNPLMYYLRDRGVFIHLPTNQIGMDQETLRAIYHCVDRLYLSTDGIGDEQAFIRGTSGAEKLLSSTLAGLIELRQKSPDEGKPGQSIICNTTVSRFNAHQLKEIAEHAAQSGFDEIHFELAGEMTQEMLDASQVDGVTPSSYFIKEEDSILLDDRQAAALEKQVMDIKRNMQGRIAVSTSNIETLTPDMITHGTFDNRRCFVATCETTIDPSGNLVGCMFFNNYKMGNLVDGTFNEAWSGEKRLHFLDLLKSGRLPMCEHCIVGVQRNPNFVTSLKRVYNQRVRSNWAKLR